jgi:hypothetical protein
MSARANPYHNAWTESLIGTIKTEMLQGGSFDNFADAKIELFAYIDSYYNTRRKHSALGYLSPTQFDYHFPPRHAITSRMNPKNPMQQTLPTTHRPASLRPVKYLSLVALLFLSGCETFTHIAVTDLQGAPISEWIAEGRVKKSQGGYIIKAVERRTPPPYPTLNRYPNGRIATVVGPNIVLQEIDKPDWLSDMEVR